MKYVVSGLVVLSAWVDSVRGGEPSCFWPDDITTISCKSCVGLACSCSETGTCPAIRRVCYQYPKYLPHWTGFDDPFVSHSQPCASEQDCDYPVTGPPCSSDAQCRLLGDPVTVGSALIQYPSGLCWIN